MLSVSFSSKCSLFHNSNIFGSCISHILYTGVLKFKKNNSGAKSLIDSHERRWEFFYSVLLRSLLPYCRVDPLYEIVGKSLTWRETHTHTHAPSVGAAARSYIRAANRVVRLHIVLNSQFVLVDFTHHSG